MCTTELVKFKIADQENATVSIIFACGNFLGIIIFVGIIFRVDQFSRRAQLLRKLEWINFAKLSNARKLIHAKINLREN